MWPFNDSSTQKSNVDNIDIGVPGYTIDTSKVSSSLPKLGVDTIGYTPYGLSDKLADNANIAYNGVSGGLSDLYNGIGENLGDFSDWLGIGKTNAKGDLIGPSGLEALSSGANLGLGIMSYLDNSRVRDQQMKAMKENLAQSKEERAYRNSARKHWSDGLANAFVSKA